MTERVVVQRSSEEDAWVIENLREQMKEKQADKAGWIWWNVSYCDEMSLYLSGAQALAFARCAGSWCCLLRAKDVCTY